VGNTVEIYILLNISEILWGDIGSSTPPPKSLEFTVPAVPPN